jgi:hypothetical protein
MFRSSSAIQFVQLQVIENLCPFHWMVGTFAPSRRSLNNTCYIIEIYIFWNVELLYVYQVDRQNVNCDIALSNRCFYISCHRFEVSNPAV